MGKRSRARPAQDRRPAPPQPPPPAPERPPRFGALALGVLVLALYLPSLGNEFVYDDFVLIVDQLPPHGLGDLFAVFAERHWYNLPYYRPVARFTMVAQKALHGDTAWAYHLFNALLIAGCAVLVYALLRLPRLAIRPSFALLAAVLFAAHPIASEVVYPACSGRESLIPAIFVVAALYAHLRATRRWRILSWIFFAAALLSKEQAIVLPAILLLADLCELPEDADARRRRAGGSRWWVSRYAPFVLTVAAYLLLRRAVFGNVLKARVAFWDDPLGPAASVLYALQSIGAPFWQLVYEPRWEVWVSPGRLALVAAAVGGLGYALARLALWPTLRRRCAFWAGFSLLALAPTANLLVQEARFAERFVFLSLLGVVAALATCASALPERARSRATAGAVVLVLGLALVSAQRGRTYRDNVTFLSRWASTDPTATLPVASLGEVYARRRAFDQALGYFKRALDMGSTSPEILTAYGSALVATGHSDQALPYFQRALQRDPTSTRAREAMGNILAEKGEAGAAMLTYEAALRDNPKDLGARIAYGNVLQDAGRSVEAVAQYRTVIAMAPEVREGHYNLARALASQGRNGEAIAAYQRSLAISPEYAYAHHNVGLLLLAEGKAAEAVPHFDAAYKYDARLSGALTNAANALLQLGRYDDALVRLRSLAGLQPGDPKVRVDIGVALARAGRQDEARRAFLEALDITPDFAPALANLEQLDREVSAAKPTAARTRPH